MTEMALNYLVAIQPPLSNQQRSQIQNGAKLNFRMTKFSVAC